jgi:hypothetical protein
MSSCTQPLIKVRDRYSYSQSITEGASTLTETSPVPSTSGIAPLDAATPSTSPLSSLCLSISDCDVESPEVGDPTVAALTHLHKLREELSHVNTYTHELLEKLEETLVDEAEKLNHAVERIDNRLAALVAIDHRHSEEFFLNGADDSGSELVHLGQEPGEKVISAGLLQEVAVEHETKMHELMKSHASDLEMLQVAYEAEMEKRTEAFRAKIGELIATNNQELQMAAERVRVGMY